MHGSREEDLKCLFLFVFLFVCFFVCFIVFFLPYMGIVTILFSGTVCTNCQYPFDRRPNVKSGEKWSSSFREDI